MTPNEIRIAVAELCGWKFYDDQTACCPKQAIKQSGPFGKRCHTDWVFVPNYPASLDACAEFTKGLFSRADEWNKALYLAVFNHSEVTPDMLTDAELTFALNNATPLQRCEAFLRLNNKWVE